MTLRVLTDAPGEANKALGELPWLRTGVDELGDMEQDFWRTLSGNTHAHLAELRTPSECELWRRLVLIGDAPRSQLTALHELLTRAKLDGPTACLALGGRGFRGQRARSWSVLSGNLFLTVALSPNLPATQAVPSLLMLPAVATCDFLREQGLGERARVKWVNDILIDGAKAGGVLTTSHIVGQTLQSAVIGIGLNVAMAPDLAPTPFVPRTTCLHGAGLQIDLCTVLLGVLAALAKRYQQLLDEGGEVLLDGYRRAGLPPGTQVRVWNGDVDGPCADGLWPGVLASGAIETVEADLALRLRERGEPVRHGRLALEKDCIELGIPRLT